jgi:16S rRNA G527 N7-methylase RsmG
MFPHLGVILIEVSKKKQKFLNALISTLGLKDIEVCDIDWRTFLRKTESDVEYFLTRASIDPVELVRMFRPGCFYKNVKLVYWAAENWLPNKLVEKFVSKEFAYSIKRKKRKLVLMEKA